MPSLEMNGPYDFTVDAIDTYVETERIGNFALGRILDNGNFLPKYVGRSDIDLNVEMKSYLTSRRHPKFKFIYAESPRAAYDKECRNYHDFINLIDNDIHPRKPDRTNYPCPVCGQ